MRKGVGVVRMRKVWRRKLPNSKLRGRECDVGAAARKIRAVVVVVVVIVGVVGKSVVVVVRAVVVVNGVEFDTHGLTRFRDN